jgi:hypothetical protein
MRKGLITLAVIVLAGAAAFFITRRCLVPSSPSSWLCREYGLPSSSEASLSDLERSYGSRCGPFCDAMCDANARLETLALGSGSVTAEIRASIAQTDRIRTETRIAMMEHFYTVAARLPPDKRRDYLLKVLPLVVDSCGRR